MKAAAAGVAFATIIGAIVIFTQPQEAPPPPGAVSWSVDAHRSVSWSLDCRVMATKLSRDRYNPHDWVNRMTIEGKGAQTGHLVTDNGRCTLAKARGKGPATLTLAKTGVEQAGVTDTGAKAAYVEVF